MGQVEISYLRIPFLIDDLLPRYLVSYCFRFRLNVLDDDSTKFAGLQRVVPIQIVSSRQHLRNVATRGT